MIARSTAVLALVASFWSTASSAAVFTYTDEAQYLAKLASLGHGQWSETFEGGVWDGLRTTVDVGGHRTYSTAAAATSQGIAWQGPSYRSPITTQQRYRPLPGETTYPVNAWSLTAVTRRNGDLDAFVGSSAGTLYGVGGWFDSVSGYKMNDANTAEIPKGHMFVSLDGSLPYNDFGAGGDADPDKLINGIGYFNSSSDHVPRFFGIVDTAGFNSFIFSSDTGLPPVEAGSFPGESSEPGFYGPVVYADNFTFAGVQAPVPEPSVWAAMMAGLLLLGLRRGRRAALAN